MMPSGSEWIIVILVVVVIFGASRLPLLGRNLGQGIKEFRKGVSEARKPDKDEQSSKDSKDTPAQAPQAIDPAPPVPPAPPAPPASGTDGQSPDRIADRRD
jgi:sec-independent protein translocase protein TatA